MLFDNLPFDIKGDVLSYLGNYIFRKFKNKVEFVLQISREKIMELEILLSKIIKRYIRHVINPEKKIRALSLLSFCRKNTTKVPSAKPKNINEVRLIL